jgi:hypothetical protein
MLWYSGIGFRLLTPSTVCLFNLMGYCDVTELLYNCTGDVTNTAIVEFFNCACDLLVHMLYGDITMHCGLGLGTDLSSWNRP